MGIHAMYDAHRRGPGGPTLVYGRAWRVEFKDDNGKPDSYIYYTQAEADREAAQLVTDGHANVRIVALVSRGGRFVPEKSPRARPRREPMEDATDGEED